MAKFGIKENQFNLILEKSIEHFENSITMKVIGEVGEDEKDGYFWYEVELVED